MRLDKMPLFVLVSILCTGLPTIARGIPQAPLKGVGRDAAPPGSPDTPPPANNAPLTQPSALSGAEDKSYVSFAAVDISKAMLLQSQDQSRVMRKDFEFPLTLFSYSAHLTSNNDVTAFAPEFVSMDVLGGVEWGVQDLSVFLQNRTVTGPGISLRIDLSHARHKWVDSYNRYRESLSSHTDASVSKAEILYTYWRAKPAFDVFLDDFIRAARAPRISAFLTHQWLDGTRLATGGLSLSQVFPIHRYADESGLKNVWGLVPRIALQGIGEDLTRMQATRFGLPRYGRSVRASLGLALQDNVTHLLYDKSAKAGDSYPDKMDIARWRLQAGVEYVFQNAVDGAESYGLYARLRSLKNHNEVSVSVSRTPRKDVQFGLGFTYTHD